MKPKIIVLFVVAAFLFAMAGPSSASVVKWSQLPSMTNPGDAYSFSSETQVPSQVADDFLCEGGAPVIGLTWWGSYWDTMYQGTPYYPYPNSDNWGDPAVNPPGIVSGFMISFYADIPAGQGVPPWSHPGSLLYAEMLPLDGVQVKESYYGQIVRSQSIQTVFQYDAVLSMPFAQEAGNIYWLSIQAIDPNGNPLQWGWQESINHWNDNAVQQGFSSFGWWDLLPGEDMSFELHVVPLPSAILLLGSGILGLAAVRKRQSRRENGQI